MLPASVTHNGGAVATVAFALTATALARAWAISAADSFLDSAYAASRSPNIQAVNCDDQLVAVSVHCVFPSTLALHFIAATVMLGTLVDVVMCLAAAVLAAGIVLPAAMRADMWESLRTWAPWADTLVYRLLRQPHSEQKPPSAAPAALSTQQTVSEMAHVQHGANTHTAVLANSQQVVGVSANSAGSTPAAKTRPHSPSSWGLHHRKTPHQAPAPSSQSAASLAVPRSGMITSYLHILSATRSRSRAGSANSKDSAYSSSSTTRSGGGAHQYSVGGKPCGYTSSGRGVLTFGMDAACAVSTSAHSRDGSSVTSIMTSDTTTTTIGEILMSSCSSEDARVGDEFVLPEGTFTTLGRGHVYYRPHKRPWYRRLAGSVRRRLSGISSNSGSSNTSRDVL